MSELENLVALQKTELEIRAIESRLARIPEEVADLEKEIAAELANLQSAEEKLAEGQKRRRALEGELEAIETKISKYKDQLMQVKTNEEYRAMQRQIESAQQEASAKEDDILTRMEENDQLQVLVKKRKEELARGQERVKAMEGDLEREKARLEEELAQRQAERERTLQTVPERLLAQYRQVAKVRGGIGVAEARDEHCQVCHVRLRPQVYAEVRSGEKILRCDSCGRILYYVGPPPAPSQDEAGSTAS